MYLREVVTDIKVLKAGLTLSPFERERYENFQDVVKAYTFNYCTCTAYNQFTREDQIRYLVLRSEINNLLRRNDQYLSSYDGMDEQEDELE